MSWLFGSSSEVDATVDKATSELLPAGTEDIALNLEICDQIRSKTVPAKDAVRSLKRRLNHKNPNVQLLTLGLTDTCIKNGGDHFLQEIASRDFMDNLVSILKMPALNHEVKAKIVRLVQNWANAFEGKPMLSYVGSVYKSLKDEGFSFPPPDPTVLGSAMVDTRTAPEWIDSDVCLRCRTAFTFTNRKHHCRNCGQVFDQQCSSKSMPLPHYGITQAVRVCDSCYSKLQKSTVKSDDRRHRHHHSGRHRSAREFDDAELQRAIQLSLQEVGAASVHGRPGYVPAQPSHWQSSEPPLIDRRSYPAAANEDDDPELRAAIEASLREANAPKASAPVEMETPRSERQQYFTSSYSQPEYAQSPQYSHPTLPNHDLAPLESDVILTFNQAVEHVHAQNAQDIGQYPAVNELYNKAHTLTPKLSMSLDDTGRKHDMLNDMHSKLSQAVKLYDRLLTDQVSRPAWQSPQQNTQYNPSYSQPYAVNGTPAPMYGGQPQMASTSTITIQPYAPPPQVASPPPISAPAPPHSQWAPSQPQYYSEPSQQQRQYSVQSPPPSVSPTTQYPNQSSQPAYTASMPPTQVPPTPAPQSPHQAYGAPAPTPYSYSSTPYAPTAPYAQSYQPPQPVQQQQQQQQPPAMPNFPVAPTSTPQAYPGYGPSVPTAPPQPEREAMLIDL